MWDDKGSSARRQKHCQQKTKKTFHDTLSMLGGFVQIALLELRRRLGDQNHRIVDWLRRTDGGWVPRHPFQS